MSAEIANEFWWSKLGFWILVVGLAGEILVLRVPKSRETLEKILTFFFVVVIIVGVTLEHNADTAVADLISKQEIDAGIKIASLGKEAAETNEHAKLLAKETEELKSKNLALEAEIAPRDISADDAIEIIDSLRLFSGRDVSVKSYLGDTEGHRLLFVLTSILARAGLKPTPGHWNFDETSAVKLLRGMEIDAPPEQSDLADALQKALSITKLGIRPRWYEMQAGTPVSLYIGVKPTSAPGLP